MNAPTIQIQLQPETLDIEAGDLQPLSVEETALVAGGTAITNSI